MSRTAIAAWYIDMCVNAPLPVMSPIAQSPSPARMSLVGVERPGVRVEPDGVQAEVGEVRPSTRRDQQLVGLQGLVAGLDA